MKLIKKRGQILTLEAIAKGKVHATNTWFRIHDHSPVDPPYINKVLYWNPHKDEYMICKWGKAGNPMREYRPASLGEALTIFNLIGTE